MAPSLEGIRLLELGSDLGLGVLEACCPRRSSSAQVRFRFLSRAPSVSPTSTTWPVQMLLEAEEPAACQGGREGGGGGGGGRGWARSGCGMPERPQAPEAGEQEVEPDLSRMLLTYSTFIVGPCG